MSSFGTARRRCPVLQGQLGNGRDISSLDAFFRKHPVFGVLVDHLGNSESLFLREQIAEELYMCRLATVVKFRQEGVAKLPKQTARVVLHEHGKTGRPPVDETCQNLQIDLHQLADTALAHLEHHVAAVEKSRGMNLTDGRTPQWRPIEKCEELVGWCAQVFLNDVGNGLCRQRGHFVLQLRQLRPVRVGQQIATGRQDLTELDEQRTEFLACATKVFRSRAVAGLVLHGSIVDDARTVACQTGQDLAVARSLPHNWRSTVLRSAPGAISARCARAAWARGSSRRTTGFSTYVSRPAMSAA